MKRRLQHIKAIYWLFTLCLTLTLILPSFAQDKVTLSGKVIDKGTKESLPGATISIKGTKIATATDADGEYTLLLDPADYEINVSYIGFQPISINLEVSVNTNQDFELTEDGLDLQGFEIVSTGYQQLSKERATGSFVHVNKELLDRRVSTNLLERLEDVTPGLIFNRGSGSANDPLSIRGRSTINANVSPLIIVDNFPYDGDIENINPNDVESITILRDAASASIWGAQAGNGVIVITTKSGKEAAAPNVSFNSNITFIEEPDLFYQPQMNIGDFIEVERMLFNRGYYNSQINNSNRPVLSPVVEDLLAARSGIISQEEADIRLESYKNHDVRRDLQQFYNQPSLNQQYSLSVNGGNKIHKYYLSGGYDGNRSDQIGDRLERYTLTAKNSWTLKDDKLRIGLDLYYTRQENSSNTNRPSSIFPYSRFIDDNGVPLSIDQGVNRRYLQGLEHPLLLNWQYTPLDEIGILNNSTVRNDMRLNTSIAYEILPGLRINGLYQFWNNSSLTENISPVNSFTARNLINQFVQIANDGSYYRAIPLGGILNYSGSRSLSHSLRTQLTYTKKWNIGHLNALGGYEVKDLSSSGNGTRFYGYDHSLGISQPVDYITRYRRFYNQGNQVTIPNSDSHFGISDRFVSYFANASYEYDGKYTVSASARRDMSNLFGVNANQRGVPLWSTGLSWNLSEESFYNVAWLPYLRLRSTYGYNGNVDKRLSAYTTIRYLVGGGEAIYNDLPYATIVNPPNPDLRWERIQIINIGMDFSSKGDKIAGSFEFFSKNGIDLIGDINFPPSSGVSSFRGNFASTQVRGLDVELHTINLDRGVLWRTDFFLSAIAEEVTGYFQETPVVSHVTGNQPRIGKPLHAMYSYPWAGLDGQTGDPLSFYQGEPSSNYSGILNEITMDDVVYHGSKRPQVFGAVRNSLNIGKLSLSFNISYRLKYFYRRETVDYSRLLTGVISHADYANRWTQPGDEQFTQVPSIPQSINNNRELIYRNSEHLVERGDHIRFQDLRIGYLIQKSTNSRLPFKRAEVYTYLNNLGIIWKSSNDELDPDFRTMRTLTSVACGIKIDL